LSSPARRGAPVEEVSLKIDIYREGLRVVSYRVIDVPGELVARVSRLLAADRLSREPR
jgi:hypothetical protein